MENHSLFRVTAYLLVFWAMQVVAQLFFKWGSLTEPRWWVGFLGGNLFGFTSIWLLMLVYRLLSPNLALALATAGAFVFGQIGISLAFKATMAPFQWVGIAVIVLGVAIVALGGEQCT